MGKRTEKPDRLTHERVRDAEAPEAGAITFWDNDPKVPGFGARIYAGGSNRFSSIIGSTAVSAATRSGSFPAGPSTAARERAKELRRKSTRGTILPARSASAGKRRPSKA